MGMTSEAKILEMENALAKESNTYGGMGIKLLAIAGGLLGSLFVVGFIFMFFGNSSTASIIAGLVTLMASVYLNRKYDNIALDTACIGGYVCACAMIGYGIDKAYGNDNVTTLAMLAIGIIVLCMSTSYMLNFLSVLIVSAALFAFMNINRLYEFIHLLVAMVALGYTLISLYEGKLLAYHPRINVVYNPWRNALMCSLLALFIFLAIDNLSGKYIRYEWISSLVIIGIYLFFINRMIKFFHIGKQKSFRVYLFSLLVMSLAVFSPAICGALLILIISFHTGHRPGLILSVVALLYFTGQFYYDLQYSLLVKSGMMFITGILFLSAGFLYKITTRRYDQD